MASSFFSAIKSLLTKTSANFTSKLSQLFRSKKPSQELLDELEALLLTSDLGPKVTQDIIKQIAAQKFEGDILQEQVESVIAAKLYDSLKQCEAKLQLNDGLTVIVMCGVNGNGKTTSIGKVASHFVKQGKKVAIAACDTFRAAAVEQLEVWGKRSGCTVIRADNAKADPASVAYRAAQYSLTNNVDILLIDTAGRLHNQANLMSELTKIIATVQKVTNKAPEHIWLVLDATVGQHAHLQVVEFQKYAGINGLIITKLDGTAKAGVVVGLAEIFKLPIYFLGTGETLEDIASFDAKAFAGSLISD